MTQSRVREDAGKQDVVHAAHRKKLFAWLSRVRIVALSCPQFVQNACCHDAYLLSAKPTQLHRKHSSFLFDLFYLSTKRKRKFESGSHEPKKSPLRNPRPLRRGRSSQLAAAHIRNYSINITASIGRIPPTVRVFFTSPTTGPVREGKPAKASRAKPNITAPPPSSPNLPETATQQPRIRYTLGTNIPPVPNTGGFVCSGRLHKIFY